MGAVVTAVLLGVAAVGMLFGFTVAIAGAWLLFRDFFPHPLRDREHGR